MNVEGQATRGGSVPTQGMLGEGVEVGGEGEGEGEGGGTFGWGKTSFP